MREKSKQEYLKSGERFEPLGIDSKYIIQSKSHYRFTADSVKLANFVPKSEKGVIVDLGTGSGIIAILLSLKTRAERIIGVEIQQDLADMACRSVKSNQLCNIEIINSDLCSIHQELGLEIADAVVFNPPFEKVNQSLSPKDSIAKCNAEIEATLEDFISCGAHLLKFGKYCYMVICASRLAESFSHLRKYALEPKECLLQAKNNNVDLALIKAKKGGKVGLKIEISKSEH